jgi:hypothetical protein
LEKNIIALGETRSENRATAIFAFRNIQVWQNWNLKLIKYSYGDYSVNLYARLRISGKQSLWLNEINDLIFLARAWLGGASVVKIKLNLP